MKIRYLVMDVDGTLTDGKIHMSAGGELFKSFDIKDGLGIHDLLPRYGITPVIITGRVSEILLKRCSDLGIKDIYQGIGDKVAVLDKYFLSVGISAECMAYIGDDLNDLEAMKKCGLKGCPSDAAREIKSICDFISVKKGGDGAVRDFIEFIIK